MTYETESAHAEVLLRMRGDIDLSCASQLNSLARALARKDRLVIDVADVGFADTTFLRFLMQLRHGGTKTSQPRPVRLVGATGQLRRILEVTGLSKVFAILSP